jgi:hypothetical protein
MLQRGEDYLLYNRLKYDLEVLEKQYDKDIKIKWIRH